MELEAKEAMQRAREEELKKAEKKAAERKKEILERGINVLKPNIKRSVTFVISEFERFLEE